MHLRASHLTGVTGPSWHLLLYDPSQQGLNHWDKVDMTYQFIKIAVYFLETKRSISHVILPTRPLTIVFIDVVTIHAMLT
jgi:hypothetical protein